MKIKDEVLEDLRKKIPWNEIVKKYHGKSAIYSALAEFCDETDKILDARYHELKQTKNELKQVNLETTTLKSELQQSKKNEENLSARCQKLSEEERQKKTSIEQLETRAAELQKKGYSPQVMTQLLGNDSKSATELLERVSTSEKHTKTKNDLTEINKRMELLQKEVANTQTKKQQLERSIISQRNELDEMNNRTATFKDAITLATILFKMGYSTEEIKSLIVGLNVVGITGNNEVSLKRLVAALKKLKTLELIDKKITGKENELAELEKTIKEIKSKLLVAKDKSLQSITEASDAAKKTIAELSNQITKHTQNAAEKFKSNLDSSLANSRQKFDDNLASSLTNADNHLKNLAENLQKNLGEWQALQEEAARVKEHILPGQALLSVLGSIEDLKNVDLALVAQLFERLTLWFELNLKETTTRPTDDIHKKDSELKTYSDYKLSGLVELVSKGVKQQLLGEKNKNAQKER